MYPRHDVHLSHLASQIHEIEAKYYADGEDAYAMRKKLRELTPEEQSKSKKRH